MPRQQQKKKQRRKRAGELSRRQSCLPKRDSCALSMEAVLLPGVVLVCPLFLLRTCVCVCVCGTVLIQDKTTA
jgi:hypothetical protein